MTEAEKKEVNRIMYVYKNKYKFDGITAFKCAMSTYQMKKDFESLNEAWQKKVDEHIPEILKIMEED